MTIADKIDAVTYAAAHRKFWDSVKSYGGKREALRAYDCQTIEEAIQMLSRVIPFSIYKMNGEVIVEVKDA